MFKKLNLTREDQRNLIALLAVGLVLRCYAFSQIYMISLDGMGQYIPLAKLFSQGEYLQAVLQRQLPLYPFLIGIFSHITGDLELAGQLISIIFSLLAVFPLYLIGKVLFGSRPAFWTAVAYLIHPLMLQISVDVLKEGLLIFLLFSSVYCSLRFLQEGKRQWLTWTIVFAIVGALVRVITLEVVLIMGLWLGFRALRARMKDRNRAYRYLWVAILVIGVMVAFVIPGIWGWEFVVEKKPYVGATKIFQRWFVYQWPHLSEIGAGILYIIGRFIEKAYPLPLLLALFGLGWRVRAREFSAEERYLAFLMAVLIIIFFPILYASGRYLLPAIFLFDLWAGFGFVMIRELLDRRFPRYPALNAMIPIMVLLITSIPFSFQPQRIDKIGRKEVGLWLQERSLSSPVIMTNIPRTVYYAKGEYVLFPQHVSVENILYRGRRAKVDYLVIEEKRRGISHSLSSFVQNGELELILRHSYGREGRTIYVYRLGTKRVGEYALSSYTILHRDSAIWFNITGWMINTPPYCPAANYAIDLEYRTDGNYLILHKDGAIWDNTFGWITTTPPYYPGSNYAQDLELTSDGSYTILHRDGALWNSSAGWTLTRPPYYKGSGFAQDFEYRSDNTYLILHQDGAVYDSALGWVTNTPPYYRGAAAAIDLEQKPDGKNYAILYQDGALWSTDGGWVLTSPPYYARSGYATDIELKADGNNYYILHRNGAIYDSEAGWTFATLPRYPGQKWALDLEVREEIRTE